MNRGRGRRNPQTNPSPDGASAGRTHRPHGSRASSSGGKGKFMYVAKDQSRSSPVEPKAGTLEQDKCLIHSDVVPKENCPVLVSPSSRSKDKFVYVAKDQARSTLIEPITGTLEQDKSLFHSDMAPKENSPLIFYPSSRRKDKFVYVAKDQARSSPIEPMTCTPEQDKSLFHSDMALKENSPLLFSPSSGRKDKFVYVAKDQARSSPIDPMTGTTEQDKSLFHSDMAPKENSPPLFSPSSGSKDKFIHVAKDQARSSPIEPKTGTPEQDKSFSHSDMAPKENSPPSCSAALSHKGTQIAQSIVNLTNDSVKSNELNISSPDLTPSVNCGKVGTSSLKGPKPLASDKKPENSEPSSVSGAFDICPPKATSSSKLKPSLFAMNRERRSQVKQTDSKSGFVRRPGMVLLKNFISLSEQVKIVKRCRDLGLGPGGFYQPGYRDGAKLHLNMMCLGKNWDPESSQYGDIRPTDGAKPPLIPDEFYQLVEKAIKDSHVLICEEGKVVLANAQGILPNMKPDICLVNFYSANGRLGLHQDRDESPQSIKKGLPVVSFSIGDSAEFVYSDERDGKVDTVTLESGDVLIFGGESRNVFHGVASIKKDSAPQTLLEETNLRQGRLNLTFRQY